MLFFKLKSPWLLVFLLTLSVACEDPGGIDLIEDTQEEMVKTFPHTYDTSGRVIPGQYVVILKTDKLPTEFPTSSEERLANKGPQDISDQHMKMAPVAAVNKTLRKYGISNNQILQSLEGPAPAFLLNIDAATAEALSKDKQVEIIEENKVVALNVSALIRTPFVPSNEGTTHQVNTYGVNRVGGSVDFSRDNAWNSRWAWIMDSGVDYDHPDLYVNTQYSRDFSGSGSGYDDRLGHGTHVAGIIGAKKNNIGVEGVAAGCVLLSVKVLDDQGEGSTMSVLQGLYHVYRYGVRDDVVNISLGGTDNGIIAWGIGLLSQLGARVVVAAGNSAQDAKTVSPANIDNPRVYTVGAIDWNDRFSSYSNYGSVLDYVAPGDGILSTYPGGKYAYMGGTSMAAPHVTGVMLLSNGNISTSGQIWSKNRYLPVPRH